VYQVVELLEEHGGEGVFPRSFVLRSVVGVTRARVRGFDQFTPETSLELSDGFLLHRFLQIPDRICIYFARGGVPEPF
jgi:hypothetical protein